MENHKLKVMQFPDKLGDRAAGELLYCGEIVPHSGIYEAIHNRHNPDSEGSHVVALRGEFVQPCKSCGDQVRLRLLYAAPHISEDGDFSN